MKLPTFQNEALLRQALTHSSYANEHPGEGGDYERLEFLGDGVLELVVRDLLFAHSPELDEGEMTKQRSRLVDRSSLANLAVKLDIPARMRIGAGSQHERNNPKFQADMFEAVIGAYYRDSGIEAAYSYLEGIFCPLVEDALKHPVKDPVTELNEYVQAHFGTNKINYLVVDESGLDHAKVFTLEVQIGSVSYGFGQGKSKPEAKRKAAFEALGRLKE